jgi:Skp family chaperone for outer membrane proteins
MDDRIQQGVLNVKAAVNLSHGLLLGLACTVTASSVWAQSPSERPTGRPAARPAASAPRAAVDSGSGAGGAVAGVDLGFIFKNHGGFNRKMEQMKTEVQQYEEKLRAEHTALTQERDKLTQQWKPGSPEYDAGERALADKFAKLQVDTQMKKKDFLQREAKVYFEVYQEVNQAIQEFADMNRIDLVLRYNGDEIDPDDRQSVLTGVNRAIVYHRNLDITRDILDRLNRAPRVSRAPAAGKK